MLICFVFVLVSHPKLSYYLFYFSKSYIVHPLNFSLFTYSNELTQRRTAVDKLRLTGLTRGCVSYAASRSAVGDRVVLVLG